MEDLIEECSEAIYDFSGIKDGVKRRQIYDDISFMESSQGWSIELDRLKDGQKVFYRYANKDFSISNQGINPNEAVQLKESISILSRFKGLPQFEWIAEMQIRLQDTFKLKGNKESFVSFEVNPYLKGLDHFTLLFNAILNKQPLSIVYKGFKQDMESSIIFHPWHIKQFNNRWFLFGLNAEFSSISNLAMDRIISVADSKVEYKRNEELDFEEFFEDVIGVTVNQASEIEKVILEINNDSWPYIESKPLHGSQKIRSKTDNSVQIELELQINHELLALLFSYMDSIEVLEPQSLREKVKNRIEAINKKYL